MMEIFGGGPQPQGQPIVDIFGGGRALVTPAAPTMAQMYADQNMTIQFTINKGGQHGEYNIKAFFSNNQMAPISQVTL